jgi:putative hydrolase of the HAD superfamily
MAEVRAVLWDFGGVILSSPFEAFASYERQQGLPDGFLRQLNATNPDSNAWARLERSDVDLAGFAELYEAEAAAAGHRIDAGAVLALLSGELRPAMVQALRRIRGEGLVQACLTNNVAGMEAARPELAEVMDIFDAVLESSKLGVTPTEAVFLDDLGINLKPARALGITTIKVVDPDEALAELEEVLGFPLS